MIKKKNKYKKLYYSNKKITKKIIYILKYIKKIKYFLEIFAGNDYIKNSIIKLKKIFKIVTTDKNLKILKKNIKNNNLKKIKKNKYITKNKIKNLKKTKKNIITLNPPYIKYKNINIKKSKIKNLNSNTNLKNKNEFKKYIKIIKKFLKKKSKIIIEWKYEKYNNK